jgi:hypothetical protein
MQYWWQLCAELHPFVTQRHWVTSPLNGINCVTQCLLSPFSVRPAIVTSPSEQDLSTEIKHKIMSSLV